MAGPLRFTAHLLHIFFAPLFSFLAEALATWTNELKPESNNVSSNNIREITNKKGSFQISCCKRTNVKVVFKEFVLASFG